MCLETLPIVEGFSKLAPSTIISTCIGVWKMMQRGFRPCITCLVLGQDILRVCWHLRVRIIFPNPIWSKWISEAVPECLEIIKIIILVLSNYLAIVWTNREPAAREKQAKWSVAGLPLFFIYFFHTYISLSQDFNQEFVVGFVTPGRLSCCWATQHLASRALRRQLVRPLVFDLAKQKTPKGKQWKPGDSKGPFDPLVGGHQQPLKGSLNHPKKGHKELPGMHNIPSSTRMA